ncbi:hypothetical protein V2I01_28530 [Micromonospora sp. BRA006-A]|nr:hypothetical protein [Micromonospora sp. BRA006-A]
MSVLPLADATSAADIPGVRLLGLVVGGLFLLIAIGPCSAADPRPAVSGGAGFARDRRG